MSVCPLVRCLGGVRSVLNWMKGPGDRQGGDRAGEEPDRRVRVSQEKPGGPAPSKDPSEPRSVPTGRSRGPGAGRARLLPLRGSQPPAGLRSRFVGAAGCAWSGGRCEAAGSRGAALGESGTLPVVCLPALRRARSAGARE